MARARGLAAEHADRVPPASLRSRCERAAGHCRELAAVLDAIADVEAATERLAAAEAAVSGPPPEPGLDAADGAAGDLCVGHGSRRDAAGVCVWCRRPDG
jgi:hypothetical protein